MTSLASAAREAVRGASEQVGNVASAVLPESIAQAAGLSSAEAPTPPGKGLGTVIEESMPRRATSIKALAAGSHRFGDRSGLGAANLSFTAAILHGIGLLFFTAGIVMVLQGDSVPISFSFYAGVGLWTVAFATWFSRAIVRILHAHRKRDRFDVATSYSSGPDRTGELGSTLFALRTAGHALEVIAMACMFVGCIAWYFQDKVSGIMGYALWYIGSILWVVQHFIENRVAVPVWSTSYLLPGRTQRMRAFAQVTSNLAFLLATPFVLAGAVNMNCGWYRSAMLLWLSGAFILIGPAVTDVSAAMATRYLQYTEAAPIAAAQAAMDVQDPPSGSILSDVLDKLLYTPETMERYQAGSGRIPSPDEAWEMAKGKMGKGPLQTVRDIEGSLRQRC